MCDTDGVYAPLAQSNEKILAKALREGFIPASAAASTDIGSGNGLDTSGGSAKPFAVRSDIDSGSGSADSNVHGNESLKQLRVCLTLSSLLSTHYPLRDCLPLAS